MIKIYENMLYRITFPFASWANRIPVKIKNKILAILVSAITFCALFYVCAPVSVHLLIKCIIGSMILVLMIFFSMEGELRRPVWDKKLVGLWLVFGAIRLLSGFVTSVEYLPLACVWLILFPLFFLVWSSRRDYNILLDVLYKGVVYPVMLFLIVSLMIVPITANPFVGLSGNANAVGQFIGAAVPLIFYQYHLESTKRREKIRLLIFIAIIIATAFYTQSRTTTLALSGAILTWLCCAIYIYAKSWKYILKLVLIITILSCGFSYGILQANTVIHHSEKQPKENMDDALSGYVDRIEGKDKHAGGLENYSSGRTGIWKKVLESVNLFGHPSREHIVTERNGDVGANAHNNFLQFTYDQGIFGGGLFFLLCFVAFVKTVFRVYQKKKYYDFILYNSIVFLLMSLVTSMNLPFAYIVSFSYYICYAILFEREAQINMKY